MPSPDREAAMWLDQLNFTGRRAVVTGGASGMGAAAVATLRELGADVEVVDVRDDVPGGVRAHIADLRDPASIDAAVARIGDGVDVLVNAAGMPQTAGYRDVLACNLAGLRHLTESLVPGMPRGAAIVNISSIAGLPWSKHAETLGELLDTPTMDDALDWIDGHPDLGDPYVWSKMALNLYTLRRAPQLVEPGIRMNAVCPGNTTTPMSEAFIAHSGAEVIERISSVAGVPATPQQQADAIVFLASDLASYVTGALLNVDGGFAAAAQTRQLARPGAGR
ncbi:coniferyl-alcohol dehydrogenase [Baekduia soli]|uniref:coniferyl-alcohol dehydrogenase n=1 Tax=Baekduia soli TaxID=496014 RepID=UPI001651FC1A|nr:coniferyl-alcohol dehydrogenase [Baekduia soli]